MFIKHSQFKRRIISATILFAFIADSVIAPSIGFAQNVPGGVFSLPAVGTPLHLSANFIPAHITGLTLHPDNPFQFDFIIDTGDQRLKDDALKQESMKLVKYFMASLTVPDEQMWVNLSPQEKDRIVAPALGQTEMGRDMLTQDYILKQLTASLLAPDNDYGKKFWETIRKQAKEKLGTTEITTDTFNKIWITPEHANVYIHDKSVFVINARLRVMLEEDYLQKKSLVTDENELNPRDNFNSLQMMSQIMREIIIPAIEIEVNEGKNFAQLRQIYYSMILASWYKQNLKQSLVNKFYTGQNKIDGIEIADKDVAQKVYNQYLEAFKKGVYDLVKEDYDPTTQEIVSHKYFSGGEDFAALSSKVATTTDSALLTQYLVKNRNRDHAILTAGINPLPAAGDSERLNDEVDLAMTSEDVESILQEFNPAKIQAFWDELGIDKESLASAIIKFPSLIGLSPKRVREEWLRDFGIEKERLARAILKYPSLAGLTPERVRKDWLRDLGIGKKSLVRMILKHPAVVGYSPGRIREEWLREMGIEKESLASAIIKFPSLIGLSPKRVREEWLRELGIGKENLASVIVKHPQLAGYSPARVQEEWSRELGIEKESLAAAIVKFPSLAGYSSTRVREEWSSELSIEKEILAAAIVKFPSLAGLSPARVREEWSRELGIDKESLAAAIVKFPPLAGYSILQNLKPKKQILEDLNVKEDHLISGLIILATQNLQVLKLICDMAKEQDFAIVDVKDLDRLYQRVNKKVRASKGKTVAKLIKDQSQEVQSKIKSVIKEVLQEATDSAMTAYEEIRTLLEGGASLIIQVDSVMNITNAALEISKLDLDIPYLQLKGRLSVESLEIIDLMRFIEPPSSSDEIAVSNLRSYGNFRQLNSKGKRLVYSLFLHQVKYSGGKPKRLMLKESIEALKNVAAQIAEASKDLPLDQISVTGKNLNEINLLRFAKDISYGDLSKAYEHILKASSKSNVLADEADFVKYRQMLLANAPASASKNPGDAAMLVVDDLIEDLISGNRDKSIEAFNDMSSVDWEDYPAMLDRLNQALLSQLIRESNQDMANMILMKLLREASDEIHNYEMNSEFIKELKDRLEDVLRTSGYDYVRDNKILEKLILEMIQKNPQVQLDEDDEDDEEIDDEESQEIYGAIAKDMARAFGEERLEDNLRETGRWADLTREVIGRNEPSQLQEPLLDAVNLAPFTLTRIAVIRFLRSVQDIDYHLTQEEIDEILKFANDPYASIDETIIRDIEHRNLGLGRHFDSAMTAYDEIKNLIPGGEGLIKQVDSIMSITNAAVEIARLNNVPNEDLLERLTPKTRKVVDLMTNSRLFNLTFEEAVSSLRAYGFLRRLNKRGKALVSEVFLSAIKNSAVRSKERLLIQKIEAMTNFGRRLAKIPKFVPSSQLEVRFSDPKDREILSAAKRLNQGDTIRAFDYILRASEAIGPRTDAAMISEARAEEVLQKMGSVRIKAFLDELGMDRKSLASVIVRYPSLAGLSPRRIREEWLNELGIEKESLASAIVKFPSLVGYSPELIRENWLWELGIKKEKLASAIIKFPQLVGLSVEDNLKLKKQILVKLKTRNDQMIDGLISLALLNGQVLQLIMDMARRQKVLIPDANRLKILYKRVDASVKRFDGKSASMIIKKFPDDIETTIRPTIRAILREITDGARSEEIKKAILAKGPEEPYDRAMRSEYGLRGGYLTAEWKIVKKQLQEYFVSYGIKKIDVEKVSSTLVKLKPKHAQLLVRWGVLTEEEKNILLSANSLNADLKEKVLKKDDLAIRIKNLLELYDTKYLFLKDALLTRLVPGRELKSVLEDKGVARHLVKTMLNSRFELFLNIDKAKEFVAANQAKVGGENHAWMIVIGQGLNNAGAWIKQAEIFVEANEDIVGGSANAWRIVIGQGLKKANQWVEIGKAFVKKNKKYVNGKANAWNILINKGIKNASLWIKEGRKFVRKNHTRVGSRRNAWRIMIRTGTPQKARLWIQFREDFVQEKISRGVLLMTAWDEEISHQEIVESAELQASGLQSSQEGSSEPFDRAMTPEEESGLLSLTHDEREYLLGTVFANTNVDEVIKAIETLGQFRDKPSVPRLILKLKSTHLKIRAAAIRALRKINDQRALEPIDQLWKAGELHPYVLKEIYWAFGVFKHPQAFEILTGNLDSDLPMVVEGAAYGLGELGNKEAIPILLKQISHSSPFCRKAVVRALGKLGLNSTRVNILRERLLSGKENDFVQNEIVDVLGRSENPDARLTLEYVEAHGTNSFIKDRVVAAIKRIKDAEESKMRVMRRFGKTGLYFFPMGLGTLGYGHEWPVGDPKYIEPTQEEVDGYLRLAFDKMGNQDGVVMIDTSAAYGTGEKKIGLFLRNNKKYQAKAFIATKWGLGSDFKETNYSIENLHRSFANSIWHLGKVDLLYVHFSSLTTFESLAPLRNKELVDEMKRMKASHKGGLRFIGVTFTTPEQLEMAVNENLIDDFDVVQMYARTFLERPDLVEQIKTKGKAIVLNSPYRKADEENKVEAKKLYQEILSHDDFSILLTGTRNHLAETIGYVSSDAAMNAQGVILNSFHEQLGHSFLGMIAHLTSKLSLLELQNQERTFPISSNEWVNAYKSYEKAVTSGNLELFVQSIKDIKELASRTEAQKIDVIMEDEEALQTFTTALTIIQNVGQSLIEYFQNANQYVPLSEAINAKELKQIISGTDGPRHLFKQALPFDLEINIGEEVKAIKVFPKETIILVAIGLLNYFVGKEDRSKVSLSIEAADNGVRFLVQASDLKRNASINMGDPLLKAIVDLIDFWNGRLEAVGTDRLELTLPLPDAAMLVVDDLLEDLKSIDPEIKDIALDDLGYVDWKKYPNEAARIDALLLEQFINEEDTDEAGDILGFLVRDVGDKIYDFKMPLSSSQIKELQKGAKEMLSVSNHERALRLLENLIVQMEGDGSIQEDKDLKKVEDFLSASFKRIASQPDRYPEVAKILNQDKGMREEEEIRRNVNTADLIQKIIETTPKSDARQLPALILDAIQVPDMRYRTLSVLAVERFLRSLIDIDYILSTQEIDEILKVARDPDAMVNEDIIRSINKRKNKTDAAMTTGFNEQLFSELESKEIQAQGRALQLIYPQPSIDAKELLLYPPILLTFMGVKPGYVRAKGEPSPQGLFNELKFLPEELVQQIYMVGEQYAVSAILLIKEIVKRKDLLKEFELLKPEDAQELEYLQSHILFREYKDISQEEMQVAVDFIFRYFKDANEKNAHVFWGVISGIPEKDIRAFISVSNPKQLPVHRTDFAGFSWYGQPKYPTESDETSQTVERYRSTLYYAYSLLRNFPDFEFITQNLNLPEDVYSAKGYDAAMASDSKSKEPELVIEGTRINSGDELQLVSSGKTGKFVGFKKINIAGVATDVVVMEVEGAGSSTVVKIPLSKAFKDLRKLTVRRPFVDYIQKSNHSYFVKLVELAGLNDPQELKKIMQDVIGRGERYLSKQDFDFLLKKFVLSEFTVEERLKIIIILLRFYVDSKNVTKSDLQEIIQNAISEGPPAISVESIYHLETFLRFPKTTPVLKRRTLETLADFYVRKLSLNASAQNFDQAMTVTPPDSGIQAREIVAYIEENLEEGENYVHVSPSELRQVIEKSFPDRFKDAQGKPLPLNAQAFKGWKIFAINQDGPSPLWPKLKYLNTTHSVDYIGNLMKQGHFLKPEDSVLIFHVFNNHFKNKNVIEMLIKLNTDDSENFLEEISHLLIAQSAVFPSAQKAVGAVTEGAEMADDLVIRESFQSLWGIDDSGGDFYKYTKLSESRPEIFKEFLNNLQRYVYGQLPPADQAMTAAGLSRKKLTLAQAIQELSPVVVGKNRQANQMGKWLTEVMGSDSSNQPIFGIIVDPSDNARAAVDTFNDLKKGHDNLFDADKRTPVIDRVSAKAVRGLWVSDFRTGRRKLYLNIPIFLEQPRLPITQLVEDRLGHDLIVRAARFISAYDSKSASFQLGAMFPANTELKLASYLNTAIFGPMNTLGELAQQKLFSETVQEQKVKSDLAMTSQEENQQEDLLGEVIKQNVDGKEVVSTQEGTFYLNTKLERDENSILKLEIFLRNSVDGFNSDHPVGVVSIIRNNVRLSDFDFNQIMIFGNRKELSNQGLEEQLIRIVQQVIPVGTKYGADIPKVKYEVLHEWLVSKLGINRKDEIEILADKQILTEENVAELISQSPLAQELRKIGFGAVQLNNRYFIMPGNLRVIKTILSFKTSENFGFVAEKTSDSAMTAGSELEAKSQELQKNGGIDFNPIALNMETQGQSMNIEFNFDPATFNLENIRGFEPIFINIVPVANFPLLLGFAQDDIQQLSLRQESLVN